MTKENLWESVLAQIQLDTTEASFNTWFKNTNISVLKKNRVVISVPNTFVQEWLQNKFHKTLLKIIKGFDKEIKAIDYKIDSSLRINDKNIKKKEENVNQLEFQEIITDYETGLNPKYTFDNFVVGPFNELAHAAGFAVSENPGAMYNPLFLYSKTGLGKTHLVQAIGNKIKNNNKNKKILYLQAQKFISEIISAIRSNTMESFKKKYQVIDILIIDDIQFLSGKEKTQEEFFHIFNELYERNKQIILSSDRPPKSISALTDRLRSRFEGGMIADINYPDTETRVAILKTKAQEKNFSLSDDVCYYIVENVQRSIRELEGVLNKIIMQEQINKTPINIETVKDILKNIVQLSSLSISYNKIMKTVVDFYDVSEKEIIGTSRKKEIVKSRQILIYLLRKELNYSYPYIAKKLGGKDHTTIIYSFSKMEKEIIKNNEIKDEIHHLRELLLSI
jgi:chromosomal replication initiator protein